MQNSAIPSPIALPRVASVSPRSGDRLDLGPLALDRLVLVELAADDVGVQARAADLLADPVDEQYVDAVERELGHPLPGQHRQLLLAAEEVFRSDGLDQGGLVPGILDDRHARQDVAAAEHLAGGAADDLAEAIVLDRAMVDRRPRALPQADQEHLRQPALHVADEAGVRLDAVDDHDVIGLEGVTVEVDRKPLRSLADNHRLHAGTDRAAEERLGDPIRMEDGFLAFGGSSPVTPHRRDDKGRGPQAPEMLDNRRRIAAMLAMPRLPAVMATLCPGRTLRSKSNRINSLRTEPARPL